MTGLLETFRRTAATLLAGAQHSLEHWTEELHREQMRLVRLMVWTGATLFAGAMALVLATVLVVAVTPPGARNMVLAVLTGVYFIIFASLVTTLCLCLARRRTVLPVTRNVLAAAQLLAAASRSLRDKAPSSTAQPD
jgi:uncharacterized membrane protein YqjE